MYKDDPEDPALRHVTAEMNSDLDRAKIEYQTGSAVGGSVVEGSVVGGSAVGGSAIMGGTVGGGTVGGGTVGGGTVGTTEGDL